MTPDDIAIANLVGVIVVCAFLALGAAAMLYALGAA